MILQVLRRGHWKAAARSILSARSSYSFRYRPAGAGGHVLRVVKPASRRHAKGVGDALVVTVEATTTVRSRGRPLRIQLGSVVVRAPRGAIKAGATLTVSAGPVTGYPAIGALSVGGGQYAISTSEGEPASPVTVTVAYDPALLAGRDRPILLHGVKRFRQWVPEATTVRTSARTVTATLATFSPIDVVGNLTWVFGDLTGNRADLPAGCAAKAPTWVRDVNFLYGRNDALPTCVSSRSNQTTLYLNMVNNRGYAQAIHVTGAKISVADSGWDSSLEGIVAKVLARLASDTGDSTFIMAPGSTVTVAIARPPAQLGNRTVSIDSAPEGATAAAALLWAFLNKAEVIATPSDVLDCMIGDFYNTLSSDAGAVTVLDQMRSCISAAASLAGTSAKIKALKNALDKIADAILVVDTWYTVADLRLDELYPAHYDFDIPGTGTTDGHIHLSPTDFGSLPSGTTTTEQLTASGGTAPYTFHVYNLDDAAVPRWTTISPGGAVTINPPAGTDATVAFHIYAVDARGKHSPFLRNVVVFATGSGGAAQLTFTHSWRMLGSAGLTNPVVDCVSTSFCLAVGTGGEVHSYDGTGWTDHYTLNDDGVNSVSCATRDFCAALAYDGVETFTGSGWTNFYKYPGYAASYVSCVAAGVCILAGPGNNNSDVLVVLRDGVFGAPVKIPSGLGGLGLACASATFCLVIGESGRNYDYYAATFTGKSWSALTKLGSPQFWTGVPACTPHGACYATGGGKAFKFTPRGHTSLGAPGGQALVAISCPASSSCTASTASGRVATYNGQGWTTGPMVDPHSFFFTLSCPTTSFCAGQSYEGYSAYFRNGRWSGMQRSDPDGFVASISCAAKSFCAALDTVGEVSLFDGTSWSRPAMVDPTGNGYQMGSISCPSARFCALVDFNGRAFTYNGSRWSDGTALSPIWLDSVSCASPSMCVAISAYGDAYIFNGRRWSAPHDTGLGQNGYLQAVSCPTVTFCMAVGGDAAARYSKGSWSRPVIMAPTSASLHAISCLPSGFCMAGDRQSSGDLIPYSDGAWGPPIAQGPYADALSCTAAFYCVEAGEIGAIYVAGTSATGIGPGGSDEEMAADCPSSSLCFISDGGYSYW